MNVLLINHSHLFMFMNFYGFSLSLMKSSIYLFDFLCFILSSHRLPCRDNINDNNIESIAHALIQQVCLNFCRVTF